MIADIRLSDQPDSYIACSGARDVEGHIAIAVPRQAEATLATVDECTDGEIVLVANEGSP
jgi:hypothetical protein